MVVYSPVKVSVTRGSAFSITCSIHSIYPEGVFHLTNAKKNMTVAKPLFGHTIFYMTYFEFPEIDLKDEGEYACIYGVNISSQSFYSLPSKSLYVSVIGETREEYLNLFCLFISRGVFDISLKRYLLCPTASSSSSVVAGVTCILVLLLLLLTVGLWVFRKRWRGSGKIHIWMLICEHSWERLSATTTPKITLVLKWLI